jgi:hypothetical protein
MKRKLLLASVVLLALVLAGCGPKGGTVTLVNESTYTLTSVAISLGDSKVAELKPGQWMKASHDKDVPIVSSSFNLTESDPGSKVAISITGMGTVSGSWFIARWTSPGFSMNNGDGITITVTNK